MYNWQTECPCWESNSFILIQARGLVAILNGLSRLESSGSRRQERHGAEWIVRTLLSLSLAILKDDEGKTWNTHGGNEKCIQNRYMWTSTEEQGGQENTLRCDMVSERKTLGDKCILSLWIPLFSPLCCIVVESADFLQSYLLLEIKICWDVTSYWMANGYPQYLYLPWSNSQQWDCLTLQMKILETSICMYHWKRCNSRDHWNLHKHAVST